MLVMLMWQQAVGRGRALSPLELLDCALLAPGMLLVHRQHFGLVKAAGFVLPNRRSVDMRREAPEVRACEHYRQGLAP